MRRPVILLALSALLSIAACAGRTDPGEPLAAGLHRVDAFTVAGPNHLVRDVEPTNPDGSVNVVVEIPAGTVAKWEVDKVDGALKWEIEEQRPRVVRYLGYPGNYGMVPRSLLPEALGGDGDPLDVIVLGPAVPRGSVVPVRLLGVLKMLDDGETDDKLLGLPEEGPLSDATDLDDLDRRYPGVTTVVETWFDHYKGPGRIETAGYGDAAEAHRVLDAALAAYRESEPGAAAGR